jgi:hypothetical protein
MKDEDARAMMKRREKYECATCLEDAEDGRRKRKGKEKPREEHIAPTAGMTILLFVIAVSFSGAQSLRFSPRQVVSKTEKAKQYLADPPTIYNLDLGVAEEDAKRDKLRISSLSSETRDKDSQAVRIDLADEERMFLISLVLISLVLFPWICFPRFLFLLTRRL